MQSMRASEIGSRNTARNDSSFSMEEYSGTVEHDKSAWVANSRSLSYYLSRSFGLDDFGPAVKTRCGLFSLDRGVPARSRYTRASGPKIGSAVNLRQQVVPSNVLWVQGALERFGVGQELWAEGDLVRAHITPECHDCLEISDEKR